MAGYLLLRCLCSSMIRMTKMTLRYLVDVAFEYFAFEYAAF